MNFGARRWPQAEACSRTEDGTDRSITVTRHSVGPIGAKHRDHVWNSCCEPHLDSGHVRPHKQTGHMAAIASIRNRIPPLASRGPSTYGSRLKAGPTAEGAGTYASPSVSNIAALMASVAVLPAQTTNW